MKETKNEIRRDIRRVIAAMAAEEKALQSEYICRRILQDDNVRRARVVALFASLPDEPDTSLLIEELAGRCNIVLPRINGAYMDFYPYSREGLHSGAYGIMEPDGETAVAPSEIDVIIVPGVAFSSDGRRLGRGKGFYDKFLSDDKTGAYKIGVCFMQQLRDYIPCEPHDARMDAVISYIS